MLEAGVTMSPAFDDFENETSAWVSCWFRGGCFSPVLIPYSPTQNKPLAEVLLVSALGLEKEHRSIGLSGRPRTPLGPCTIRARTLNH